MTSNAILWPTIAMAALTFAVSQVLLFQRMGHIKRNPPTREDFATGAAALHYFEPVEMASNNFRNLFELPVLFFALVPLLLVTGHAGPVQVGLAWLYVALRAVHSAIHIGRGPVPRRFLAHLASTIVLMAMWIGLVARMIAEI
jgi:hypothetical protein